MRSKQISRRIKIVTAAAIMGVVLIVRSGLFFYLENSNKIEGGDAEDQIANQLVGSLINGGFWILMGILILYVVVALSAHR